MFEKFTEKAVEVVKASQIAAIESNHEKIYPEHLLIGLANQKSGMVTKLFSVYKLTLEDLKKAIENKLTEKQTAKPIEFVVFSDSVKLIFDKSFEIAKKLGNKYIQPEHLLLALIEDQSSSISKTLKDLGFDTKKAKGMLLNILDKTKKTKDLHPEGTENKNDNDSYKYIHSIFQEPSSSALFERAVAKLSTSNY